MRPHDYLEIGAMRRNSLALRLLILIEQQQEKTERIITHNSERIIIYIFLYKATRKV